MVLENTQYVIKVFYTLFAYLPLMFQWASALIAVQELLIFPLLIQLSPEFLFLTWVTTAVLRLVAFIRSYVSTLLGAFRKI